MASKIAIRAKGFHSDAWIRAWFHLVPKSVRCENQWGFSLRCLDPGLVPPGSENGQCLPVIDIPMDFHSNPTCLLGSELGSTWLQNARALSKPTGALTESINIIAAQC